MALRSSTQTPAGKGGQYIGLTILPPFICRLPRNSGSFDLPEPLRARPGFCRNNFTFFLIYCNIYFFSPNVCSSLTRKNKTKCVPSVCIAFKLYFEPRGGKKKKGKFELHLRIPIYIQQKSKLQFVIFGDCYACFGWYFHPTSGAHTTISTTSGICHTVTAICSYRGGVGTCNSSTIAADSNDGVTNTRCCRYSCMRSWWWVEVPPATCRAVFRYK
jgi:hypothetical protein